MTSKTFRFVLVITLFVLVAVSMSGCGYIESENIYGLTNEDHQLLYNADPLMTYQIDYLLDVDVSLQGQTVTMNMEGNGGFLIDENELLPGIAFAMTGTAKNDLGKTVNVSIDLREVDGVFYMKVDSLDTGETQGWQKIDLLQFMKDSTGIDLNQLSTPEQGTLTEALGSMTDLGLGKYTTVTLVGEDAVGGVATKHFLLNVDLMAFLQSADFAQYLTSSMQAGMDSGLGQNSGVDPGQMQLIVPMLKMLFPMIFPKLELRVDQYVGIDDGRLRRSVTAFDMEMNLSSLSMLTGDSAALAEPITVSLFLDTKYRDFGKPFEIEVPEDATPMPMDSILNPFGQ